MGSFMKKAVLLGTVAATLLLTSCGTKEKKAELEESAQETMTEVAEEVASLSNVELNADSDSGKAGPLQTIFFEYDSNTLTSDARAKLDMNAELLKVASAVELQIEGHCDERGGVQYNLALGEKRAMAIKDYLVAQGVSSSRLSTISFGKERPLAFSHDESAWGQNRRGNFVVTAK